MSKKSLELAVLRGAVAYDRFQLERKFLDARQDGGTIERIPVRGRLLRVLVVDDDRDTANSMSMLVKLWGHDTWEVYDAEATLEMAAAFRPDVVFLDIAMPGMDGYKVARQLRRHGFVKEPLLIAITGYSDEAHRLRGMEAGFDQYMIKPIDPSVVEKLLLLQQNRLAERSGQQDHESSERINAMLSSYPVACPHEGCDWQGNLVPSLVRGGADAEIAPLQRAWFQCPRCRRDWEVRIQGDKVVVLPVTVQGG